jgi:thiol:disulfide interchange protein DsbA
MFKTFRALACLIPLVAACSGAQPAPSPEATAAPAEPAATPAAAPAPTPAPVGVASGHEALPLPDLTQPPPAPSETWDKLMFPQHLEVMKTHVMPRMGAQFAKFDATHYGKMTCVTCHGENPRDRKFKMPNPDLPKLPMTPAGFQKLAAEKPAMLRFMKEVVTPEMARMLGEAQYDPKTQQGFGCGGCHTFAK